MNNIDSLLNALSKRTVYIRTPLLNHEYTCNPEILSRLSEPVSDAGYINDGCISMYDLDDLVWVNIKIDEIIGYTDTIPSNPNEFEIIA